MSTEEFVKPTRKNCKGRNYGEIIDLSFLIGKTIINAGAISSGFGIDYKENDIIKRVIFDYNDQGVWINWHGEINKKNKEDILSEKLKKVIECSKIFDRKIIIIKFDEDRNGFSFLSKIDKKEELFLKTDDIKLMGKKINSDFDFDSNKIINEKSLISDLYFWAYNYNICEEIE